MDLIYGQEPPKEPNTTENANHQLVNGMHTIHNMSAEMRKPTITRDQVKRMKEQHDLQKQIGQNINDYKIIINKSTVPVGTADRVKAIIDIELENRGVSIDFDVVSNPEFLKEGDAVKTGVLVSSLVLG